MAKNVKGVLFLRNNTPYESRALALTGIENHKADVADGQFILARYNATVGDATVVKTLVGVKAGDNDGYLTIIDVEGASADVEALRKEINAKLGTGVTSAASETVTAQLEALSGTNADNSGTTSVEGAKKYAYDLVGTLDHTDTAETGSYVSKVDQVDGIISTTKVELPTVTGEVESKKVVMSVSEDKGEISVTKGTIESSDKTVVISDLAEGNGIDFKVNIDGETIVKDANTGVISVASAALTQYSGDNVTIQVSAVDVNNNKTISSLLTISATTPSEANVKEQYNLVGADNNPIGATIKIYKDSALLSVALLHADYSNPSNPVLPTYNKATDTWTDIDATAQTQANQALCYAYEDVEGTVVVAAVPVGSFINEQEFASGITWDLTAGKVRGVVDPTSESFLTVGTDGFKISGVSGLVENAIEDLDATVTGATSGSHVTISIEELDGKLVQSGLTIEEDNIANADDLAGLSAKTVTEIASSNSSISATSSATADGTVKYDIVTDADKIKMSGFTADNNKVFSGIAESDSVATAFEKADTVVTGIRTDLNTVSGKVDTIESQYVSGVSVNGSAVTVADHVAPIVIQAATSSVTTSNNAAIGIATAADGTVTLGLAYIDCGTYDD